MQKILSSPRYDRDTIFRDVIRIVSEITDWDLGFGEGIGPSTRLMADLDLKSIQVVKLAVAVEAHYNLQNLPFQDLFVPQGAKLYDPCLQEIVDFLYDNLNGVTGK